MLTERLQNGQAYPPSPVLHTHRVHNHTDVLNKLVLLRVSHPSTDYTHRAVIWREVRMLLHFRFRSRTGTSSLVDRLRRSDR